MDSAETIVFEENGDTRIIRDDETILMTPDGRVYLEFDDGDFIELEREKIYTREELYYPDGRIKNNEKAYYDIKKAMNRRLEVSATEGDFLIAYRTTYAPASERSIFDSIPVDDDDDDFDAYYYEEEENRRREEEEEEERRREQEAEDIYWEEQERKEKEEREREELDLLLLMCEENDW